MGKRQKTNCGYFGRPISFALAAWLGLAGLALMPASIAISTPAAAQESEPRQGGGLLRFLFNRNEPRQPQVEQPARTAPAQQRTRPRQRSQPAPSRSSGQAAAPAAPASAEKSDDAGRVLVVGDFLAGGLADGLREAYADNGDIAIISRSNGSSGLVRDDFYNWPAEIGGILDAEEPDAVVVMIGSNDRQAMTVGGSQAEPLSERWLSEYESRSAALTAEITDRDLPFIWVGNLPFRPGSMSSDMIAFNDIYKRIVGEAGGEFVDIWTGFSDENGAFIATGPDIKGQPAQLRAGDGINVTRAGRRKMAFFVEKPIEQILGEVPAEMLSVIDPDGSALRFPDAEALEELERTAPVSLFADDIRLGEELLGASFPQRQAEQTVETGTAGANANDRNGREATSSRQSPPGRADHFGGG